MAAVEDFDEVLQRFKLAANELLKGNPVPLQTVLDVSLAGWASVFSAWLKGPFPNQHGSGVIGGRRR